MNNDKHPKLDCIFCRIIAGQSPSRVVYEDERILAFEDIHPQAPVHILIIPKEHWASLDAAPRGGEELLGRVVAKARDIARDKGLAAAGYRLVLNTGPDAGQAVPHIHFHLLGGRRLSWPPG
ncbi:MAG: histidine triad nucleotide-binding protein [Candidatus Aminicenantes bacterium]|nr:histidine triad nucleotide-binding protein [Candidatus Aminicenantes bacterium]